MLAGLGWVFAAVPILHKERKQSNCQHNGPEPIVFFGRMMIQETVLRLQKQS